MILRWFENRQVYAPSRTFEANPRDLGRPFEEIFFHTEDGMCLDGWFFPAHKGSPREHQVILLLHGNAGNISHRLDFYRAWLQLGANVLAFDYRGFGRSEGKPSEEGTYRDGQAAIRWLRERGYGPDQIILLGKSLGGGVASELALREPVGGLILQSTFTSIPDLGSELFPWLPVRRLHRIHYNTMEKLPRLRVPLLVAHSLGDDLIGFHHAERNYAAANEPKLLWKIRGNHTSTLEDGRDVYLQGLEKFLCEYVPQSLRSPS